MACSSADERQLMTMAFVTETTEAIPSASLLTKEMFILRLLSISIPHSMSVLSISCLIDEVRIALSAIRPTLYSAHTSFTFGEKDVSGSITSIAIAAYALSSNSQGKNLFSTSKVMAIGSFSVSFRLFSFLAFVCSCFEKLHIKRERIFGPESIVLWSLFEKRTLSSLGSSSSSFRIFFQKFTAVPLL